jgi:hypothetical protein
VSASSEHNRGCKIANRTSTIPTPPMTNPPTSPPRPRPPPPTAPLTAAQHRNAPSPGGPSLRQRTSRPTKSPSSAPTPSSK